MKVEIKKSVLSVVQISKMGSTWAASHIAPHPGVAQGGQAHTTWHHMKDI